MNGIPACNHLCHLYSAEKMSACYSSMCTVLVYVMKREWNGDLRDLQDFQQLRVMGEGQRGLLAAAGSKRERGRGTEGERDGRMKGWKDGMMEGWREAGREGKRERERGHRWICTRKREREDV